MRIQSPDLCVSSDPRSPRSLHGRFRAAPKPDASNLILTSPRPRPDTSRRAAPVIRARPDRRSVVASVAMPGRNPDGSYGARPDSTVPHAISEPAALTAEQEEEMAAMAKWAKAEEGMRLVQELESHSAQRDDAIANLQNMLNGIGKTTDVAEAAALAAAPPAPPVPPTGVPPHAPAANNIVPDMMPTPSPVAAVPVAAGLQVAYG